MLKNITTLLLVLVVTSGLVSAQTTGGEPVANIDIGEEIQDSLSADNVHSYILEVDSAQFVSGQVMQETVDVVITIYNPDNKEVARYDGPARGRESFQFDSRSAGAYRLEVAPFEEEQGSYSLIVEVIEPKAKEAGARVDQLMKQYDRADVPGGSVLVMQDDEVVFYNSYGMANLAYDVPMSEKTLHNIGSTSKQFTAFALLLLEERGALSLDDEVRDYIPELPEFEQAVTLRHLLTHTGGYREFINTLALTGRNVSSSLDTEKIIEIVQRQPKLQNEPGGEWNYNNTGYALAAETVHRVTGTPFPEWMKKNVFEPLDMQHTVVRNDPGQVVMHRSQGYSSNKDGEYEEVMDLGGAMGAGGIHSTMEDLSKWIRNLEKPVVGSEEIIEKMTTPFELNNGQSTEYGLGLFIQQYKGQPYYHHGGADLAHRSMLMYFPDLDAAIITQSNNASFDARIPYEVADTFFGDYFNESEQPETEVNEAAEFAYDSQSFDDLTGRYELVPGFVLTFGRDGDRIYTQATNQPEVDLTATSDSTFNLIGVQASITFHRNEDGTADSLTLNQNGQHVAHKIAWEPTPEELQALAGRYYSEELETVYTIVFEEAEEKLLLKNFRFEDDVTLSPANEDSFSGEFPVGEVSIERNEKGEVTGLYVSNGRTRDVRFERM